MKKSALLIIATGVILSLNTVNAQNNQNEKGAGQGTEKANKGKSEENQEKKFLTSASDHNNFEIQAANLAIEKASDPKVTEFAKMMLEFHGKNAKEMSSMMMTKGAEQKKRAFR